MNKNIQQHLRRRRHDHHRHHQIDITKEPKQWKYLTQRGMKYNLTCCESNAHITDWPQKEDKRWLLFVIWENDFLGPPSRSYALLCLRLCVFLLYLLFILLPFLIFNCDNGHWAMTSSIKFIGTNWKCNRAATRFGRFALLNKWILCRIDCTQYTRVVNLKVNNRTELCILLHRETDSFNSNQTKINGTIGSHAHKMDKCTVCATLIITFNHLAAKSLQCTTFRQWMTLFYHCSCHWLTSRLSEMQRSW